MALKSPTHETCSCVSPDAFKDLSSKKRKGLKRLHQREGVITEAECERIGSSDYGHGRCKVVAQIILAKSISQSLKIFEICRRYRLLGMSDMIIQVLVDVYHKEQLVTKEEAEKVASDVQRLERSWEWRWLDVAVTKDASTAARIADILDKYEANNVAQQIRVLVDIYHKEQLVTKEEAEEATSVLRTWEWRWGKFAVTKDSVTATRIADILDKYDFDDAAKHIKVLVDVYHKEQLLTKKEAEEVTSADWMWGKLAITENSVTATRIADILEKRALSDVAQHIRVLVDVYHKEQLVTREEAEKAASDKLKWKEVAITKDSVKATRIANILDKYYLNYVARLIRVLVDVYHKEQLVTKEEAEKVASDEWGWKFKLEPGWVEVAVTKDNVTATKIADILDKYAFKDVAQHIRVVVDVYLKEQLVTKEEAQKAASDDCDWRFRWRLEWERWAVTKDNVNAGRIADILDKYAFNDVAQNIRVLVDVYHNEQLLTKEEAEKIACNEWMKRRVAISKDSVTATRIADILDTYGLNKDAQRIRVLVDVYHKEQLVTKEEAQEAASDELQWMEIAVTKDSVTATRIADILDEYDHAFENYIPQHIRVLVDVYHKEQLLTKEEAEEVTSLLNVERFAITKDAYTGARIADILEKYGYGDARRIRVLVDAFHKEQLATKEEVEEAFANEYRWLKFAVNKDVGSTTRIADILDEYGYKDTAQLIRVLVDVYHKEHLVTKEEAETAASFVQRWLHWWGSGWETFPAMRWQYIAVTKDAYTAARIADILDKYSFNHVARHIRDKMISSQTKIKMPATESAHCEPKDSQYAVSQTSGWDTSDSETSPDIDSSEPKSQEKGFVIK